MRSVSPLFGMVIVGAATAALWHTPVRALPLPVTAQAIAGDGVIDHVASRSQRHYRARVVQRRAVSRHRRAYSRRYGNPAGAAFAGAALGILGGALTAATAPGYRYHDEPAYYPVYEPTPAYGYYSGAAYPAYGFGYSGGGYAGHAYPAYGYGHGGGYSGRYYGGHGGYSGRYYGHHGGGGSYTDPRVLSGQPGSLNQP